MARIVSLPLGVDFGETRVRIAQMERHRGGEVRLRAVVCRELPDDALLTSATVEEMLSELGTRERRCVIAVGMPTAVLRTIQFPKMTRAERIRAARFEAQRFVPWDIDVEPSLVRAHRLEIDSNIWAIGATKAATLEARVAILRAAGLRVVCVDHDTLAYARILTDRAVIDIGAARSTLHAPTGQGVLSRMIPLGGDLITRAIASELSIDSVSAERRKRILGVAGAGQSGRKELVSQLVALIDRAHGKIARVALTGNGARLPGLPAEIEAATGALVEIPVGEAMTGDAYPDDVLRSASPDWTLAVGLALYGCAA